MEHEEIIVKTAVKEFGDKIKILREKNNLSINQFASTINCSSRSLERWENGEGKPNLKNLFNICRKFNVSMKEFYNQKTNLND